MRALAALIALAAFGQTPEFEVVSIKPSPRGASGSVAIGKSANPGTIAFTGITPKDLIARAYALTPYQIAGPASLDEDRYDVLAKASAPASDSDQRAMLQSMLAARFHLAAHTETREVPAYDLVAVKSGPKIQAAPPTDAGARVYPNRSGIRATGVTMQRFAELLSARLDRPVLDKTGLSGVFDIDVTWTPTAASPDAEPGPSVFTALQEQLGLRLQAGKSPIKVLVVDRIERPTAN